MFCLNGVLDWTLMTSVVGNQLSSTTELHVYVYAHIHTNRNTYMHTHRVIYNHIYTYIVTCVRMHTYTCAHDKSQSKAQPQLQLVASCFHGHTYSIKLEYLYTTIHITLSWCRTVLLGMGLVAEFLTGALALSMLYLIVWPPNYLSELIFASLANVRSHNSYSCVDWSNVSKVPCSRQHQQQQ